jgi:hypothetical protein
MKINCYKILSIETLNLKLHLPNGHYPQEALGKYIYHV